MPVLIAEPSLVGFLSAFYHSYYTQRDAQGVVSDTNLLTLLDSAVSVYEDVELARKVRAAIIEKGGRTFYEDICDAYRSGKSDKENIIFNYLKLFFKHGKAVKDMFDRPEVIAFNDVLGKVNHEIHRLSSFVRLMETEDGSYYAYYASDNDIIERLLYEIVDRFNTQKILLHDYKRRKLGFYDGKSCSFSLAPEYMEVNLSERETLFQTLWKQYYSNVTIKERLNKKMFDALLPKRYRHFMNEF